ncbi:cysteine-rich receptor-like protein kinase 44 [Carex rostrata]
MERGDDMPSQVSGSFGNERGFLEMKSITGEILKKVITEDTVIKQEKVTVEVGERNQEQVVIDKSEGCHPSQQEKVTILPISTVTYVGPKMMPSSSDSNLQTNKDANIKTAEEEDDVEAWRTSNKRNLAIIIGTITSIVISVLLIICLFGYLLKRKKIRYLKQDKTKKKYLAQNDSLNGIDLPVFDMETILQATDDFSITNEVGQGAFGIVYKLTCGQEIAVKRLSMNSSQGLNEFMNEVMLISKLQHRNLVKLHGCCIDNNERILIYKFMTNKSLDFFIFIFNCNLQILPSKIEVVYNSWELATDTEKRACLSWRTRLEIVTGIARGLLYLHHDSRFNIIHRDLKAANVLLDEEMNPKISDFGTARLFEREQPVIGTETVIGTRGYMSPEYITEGTFSIKSDVYSFGVILLEIISGKRNQGNQNLLAYAWKFWEEENILKLLDAAVQSTVHTTELSRCIHVGLLCVQECPDDRPSMSSVVMMLSCHNLEIPAPKKTLILQKHWRVRY